MVVVNILILALGFATCTEQHEYDLAVEDVMIFHSQNKKVLKNKTILINDDSIALVVDINIKFRAVKTIEGKGRLVTPGFVDSHVHLTQIFGDGVNGTPEFIENNDSYRDVLSDQYLSFGTTTILDMGQFDEWMDVSLDWQKNPDPNYPNLFISGNKLISSGEAWPYTYKGFKQIKNRGDADKTVGEYANLGIGHIKLYKMLREQEMKAIVDETKQHNLMVFAHTDMSIVTIPQAMDLGVRNFEHFFTLVPSVLNMDVLYKNRAPTPAQWMKLAITASPNKHLHQLDPLASDLLPGRDATGRSLKLLKVEIASPTTGPSR